MPCYRGECRLNFSHSTREKAAKGQEKIQCCWCCADQKNSRSFFFFLYISFPFLLLIIPPIVRQTAYTRTPTSCIAKDQQQKCNQALYSYIIICLSALKNIFIDYFTLWRSDWASCCRGGTLSFPCKNKDVGSYKDQNPLTALLDTKWYSLGPLIQHPALKRVNIHSITTTTFTIDASAL